MIRHHGKLVIAVAGGRQKIPAIRGALAGKLCNVLITDEEVALALVRGGGRGDSALDDGGER
jgi:DNA-binding transcriptional regulator LsrR (DeoR family)